MKKAVVVAVAMCWCSLTLFAQTIHIDAINGSRQGIGNVFESVTGIEQPVANGLRQAVFIKQIARNTGICFWQRLHDGDATIF